MKKLGVKIVMGALVATNAFAAGPSTKGAPDVRGTDKAHTGKVAGGAKMSVRMGEDAASALMNRIDATGLNLKTSMVLLKTKLMNPSELIETTYKNAKGETTPQELSLADIVVNATGVHVKTDAQKKLASNLVDAATSERGVTKDSGVNKLLAEGNALLEPGSKATEAEIATFTEKFSALADAVRTGKANNIDEAADKLKLLTDAERKKLEECVRG